MRPGEKPITTDTYATSALAVSAMLGSEIDQEVIRVIRGDGKLLSEVKYSAFDKAYYKTLFDAR